MNDAEKNARISADSMVLDLITKQPGMIKAESPNETSGKAVGDFIAALRDRLIEMYKKAPN